MVFCGCFIFALQLSAVYSLSTGFFKPNDNTPYCFLEYIFYVLKEFFFYDLKHHNEEKIFHNLT